MSVGQMLRTMSSRELTEWALHLGVLRPREYPGIPVTASDAIEGAGLEGDELYEVLTSAFGEG